jgi:hypothetical protein
MHGFFLLLASHTLDKVNESLLLLVLWIILINCSIVSQHIVQLGLQKDSGDARAFSFLKILELIPHTSQPPSMLFVENVVGFEVCSSFFCSTHEF